MSRSTKFVPALCILLGACQLITDVSGRLEVVLAVNRTVASSPTPIEITVKVVNRGAHDVQTADPRSYGCVPPFQVIDEAGRVVALPGRLCLAIAYGPLELPPGDSVVIQDRWSLDTADGAGRAVPVGPGRYRLVARVIGKNGELASDPVAVSVITTGAP